MNKNVKKKKQTKIKGENEVYAHQKKTNLKGKLNDVDTSIKEADIKNYSKFGDPNWYFTDKDLAEQSSRFSFRSFIGDGILMDAAPLPTICTMYLNPSLGSYVGKFPDGVTGLDWAKDPSIAAINLISRKIYSRLSNKSGRTQSYAPQDVMTLILAMGEVISIASHLKRILGLSFTYNYRNRDFPRQIIRSLGVEADDFLANLSVYRVRFNTVLNMANKIPFPGNIAWFAKCSALYEGVFKDSPDDMAQIYAFVPGSTWIINEMDYEGGTILESVAAGRPLAAALPNVQTFEDWLNILKSQIDAILTSSTYNVIFGDILNMCDSQNVPLLHLNIVPEDYSVIPEYNAEILLHIHNASIYQPVGTENILEDAHGISRSRYNDVFPDPNTNNLIYAPRLQLYGSLALGTADTAYDLFTKCDIVDFPYGNPDLTERIEATRFATRIGYVDVEGDDKDFVGLPISLPDHYITDLVIWNGGEISLTSPTNIHPKGVQLSTVNISNIEKFRYMPLFYKNLSNTNGTVSYVHGDLNYFTRLNGEWNKRLNDLCMQGLLELR